MIEHRYPSKAMVGDYVRAAFGLALTGTPLLLSPAGSGATYILGPLVLLFAVFGARTAIRHRTVVEIDDLKVVTYGLWRQELKWPELIEVKLSYYSTKRDRSEGWMQLMLRGPTGKLRFDSTLDGFAELARRAHATARAKGIELTEATLSNFASLGLETKTKIKA